MKPAGSPAPECRKRPAARRRAGPARAAAYRGRLPSPPVSYRKSSPVSYRHRRHQRPQRCSDGLFHHSLHTDSIAEAHLQFGRMDVHIHILGCDLDSQIHRRPIAGMDGGTVSRLRGTDEKGILEGPAVDEQLGAPAGGLSVTRPLNESVHPKRTRRVADRHQSPCQVAAPHRSQTLGRLLIRGNRQAAGAIDVELETGVGWARARVATAS